MLFNKVGNAGATITTLESAKKVLAWDGSTTVSLADSSLLSLTSGANAVVPDRDGRIGQWGPMVVTPRVHREQLVRKKEGTNQCCGKKTCTVQ